VYVQLLIPVFIVQVTRVGTVYNKFSKIPPSTSMHFATRGKTWRVVLFLINNFAVVHSNCSISEIVRNRIRVHINIFA